MQGQVVLDEVDESDSRLNLSQVYAHSHSAEPGGFTKTMSVYWQARGMGHQGESVRMQLDVRRTVFPMA